MVSSLPVTIEGDVRKVERQTGCSISIHTILFSGKRQFKAWDPELERLFWSDVVTPSREKAALGRLREDVYHARGNQKAVEQGMKCALCGEHMVNFEIDHKESRGAHGRNDRSSNLRCVHPKCHRRRHGEKT